MSGNTSTSGVGNAQPTIVIPAAASEPIALGDNWSEVQTGDGRVYYFNSETGTSLWEKPVELKTESEVAVLTTQWREHKIWDGRSFFHNASTRCSVWNIPPEVSIAQSSNAADVDHVIIECTEFNRGLQATTEKRRDFLNLLQERGIGEHMLFAEAMDMIQDDPRYYALETPKAQQSFFASYVSNLKKSRIQASRDEVRRVYMEAVSSWKSWKGMSESVTFVQMEQAFKGKEWYDKIDRVQLVKLFHVFSSEYIEIERLKKQQLQDQLMHDMKNDILTRTREFDLGSPSVVEGIHHFYASLDKPPLFWTYLSDSLKLVVIKSCITQRLRELRMALANSIPLSRERRAVRVERDRVKKILHEVISSGAKTSVVTRGQTGIAIPKWDKELEQALSNQGVDMHAAREIFKEYVEDIKKGRDPLEGISR